MGATTATDPTAQTAEAPQFQATLATYQLDTYEVTVAEYARAVDAQAVPPSLILERAGGASRLSSGERELV